MVGSRLDQDKAEAQVLICNFSIRIMFRGISRWPKILRSCSVHGHESNYSAAHLSEPVLHSSELKLLQRTSSLLSSIRRISSDSLETTEDIEGSLDEYL